MGINRPDTSTWPIFSSFSLARRAFCCAAWVWAWSWIVCCSSSSAFRLRLDAEHQGHDSACHERQRRHGREAGDRRVAAYPLGDPLQAADRTRRHRLAAHEAPQVVGQFPGTGVAPLRLLPQALQADRLQVARRLPIQGGSAGPAPGCAPAPGSPAPSPPRRAAAPSGTRRGWHPARTRRRPDRRSRARPSACSGAM